MVVMLTNNLHFSKSLHVPLDHVAIHFSVNLKHTWSEVDSQ